MLRSSQELPAAPRSFQQLHGALRSSPHFPGAFRSFQLSLFNRLWAIRGNRSFHVLIPSGPLEPIVPFTFNRLWAIKANRSFHFLIGSGSILHH